MMTPHRNPIEVKGQRIQIPGILLCVVSPDIRNGRHNRKLTTRQEPQTLIILLQDNAVTVLLLAIHDLLIKHDRVIPPAAIATIVHDQLLLRHTLPTLDRQLLLLLPPVPVLW